MNTFKKLTSLLFLLSVVSYSVDIHALSHLLDDHHESENNCELCIIQIQEEKNFDFIISTKAITVTDNSCRLTISDKFIFDLSESNPKDSYKGQLLNRPPPR